MAGFDWFYLVMIRSTDNRWLSRFAFLTALATLFLVGLGGVVTSKGVGMAVPDWPNSFGENMFLFPFSKWVGGTLPRAAISTSSWSPLSKPLPRSCGTGRR